MDLKSNLSAEARTWLLHRPSTPRHGLVPYCYSPEGMGSCTVHFPTPLTRYSDRSRLPPAPFTRRTLPPETKEGWQQIKSNSLSPLPDDIVAKILSSVDSSPDAVRTCVLSQRWRPLWKLLPELRFPFFPEPASKFRDALDDHQVPLRHLQVEGHGQGALPKSVATWLPATVRRVSGCFALLNNADPIMDEEDEHGEEEEAIELPCFEQATSISICLGLLGSLAMPPPADGGGVFSHLTDLCLERVWFHHPSELGDVVSSARCPCLQMLKLRNTPGLEVLAIDSTSLLKMKLEEVTDLHELTVEAPELKELTVVHCFVFSLMRTGGPAAVVAIAAPELVLLDWNDDTESQRQIQAQLSQFPRLRSLGSLLLFVYGTDHVFGEHNRDSLELLQGIHQFLVNLTLTLGYVEDIENYQYLMEDMTTLPKVTTLHLIVISKGHSYGASLFHILRVCTGIRKLVLELHAEPEDRLTCPPGCNCEHQSNWRSEKLLLDDLEEIEIQRFGRTTRDLDFVERLFGWATSLTKATIIFDILVREGVFQEVCRMSEFFSRPEIHIEFRYHNNKKMLCAPEDYSY